MLHHVAVGEGRPVLIIHGGKLDHRHMVDALEPIFAETDNWRRIYIDMPGHGQSAGGPDIRSQDDVLAAVISFAESIAEEQPLAVVGESRGSYIAEGMAQLRPDLLAGLMLIVPGGNGPDAQSSLPVHETLVADEALRAELSPDEIARFDRLVVQNRTILEKIRATRIPAAALHDANLEARLQSAFHFSFDLHAKPFDKPCLIVSGRQDAIAGYAVAVNSLPAYPRATFALLDTAGHSLAWERPEVFLALARDWLTRLEAVEEGRNEIE